MKNFLAYLSSKMFWKNLGMAVGLAIVLLISLLIFLRIYTHHGHTITVPDLTDIPVEEAGRLLADRNLTYEIFDSVYVASSDRGVIIDQHPRGGKEVKKGRKVYFTINANSPEKILMPDLEGSTFREVKKKIEIAGLKIGNISYRYHIAENVVLETRFNNDKIEKNDTILKGSSIDLVLGKGLSNERRMAPDLLGLSEEEAVTRAADALFTIHSTIPDNTVIPGDTLIPRVFRQEPAHSPKIRVPLGTEIIIWVTVDSTKLPGYAEEDTLPVWENLNEAEHEEEVDDINYSVEY